MATLVKPKQKKKRKTKVHSTHDEEIEESTVAEADIEFPTTLTNNEIEFVENDLTELQMKLSLQEDSIDIKDESIEELQNKVVPNVIESKDVKMEGNECLKQEKLKKEILQPIAPTAPVFEECASATQTSIATKVVQNFQYPNLKEMQQIEQKTHMIEQKKILKPFTKTQLKELYQNPEIILAETFEEEFISNELNFLYREHQLYDLLKKFSQSRYNIKINTIDLHGFRKAFETNIDGVWKIENRKKVYNEVCQDGVNVSKSLNYRYAVFSQKGFMKLSCNLQNIIQLVCFNFMTNLYMSESYKMQIENCIREMLNAQSLKNLKPEIKLNKTIDDKYTNVLRELRVSISILFNFLRRQLPDKVFGLNVKNWVENLVAVYLRLSTWQDHLFLIFHVLRCPPGISTWAATLIQIPHPIDMLSVDEINHCMALLKVVLLPAKQRNDFLMQLKQINTPVEASAVTEDMWIVIDSDGEEEQTPTGECVGLKENDMIALFNQIPFEQLFSCMTFVKVDGEQYKLDESKLTTHHLLKFIAFSTNMIELIGEGLKTYSNERYKQFSKLLSRLVRQIVQYVSDMYSIYKTNINMKSNEQNERIQIEFDMFVLRASKIIYLSRSLGGWQYLVVLPFSELNHNTVWKLYYLLIAGFPNEMIDNMTEDFRTLASHSSALEQFNDTIFDVPAEDMCYFLQTFNSMAMARPETEFDFIYCVTVDLFKIGFTNAITKESCFKNVRDLLATITTKHTSLISSILVILKENFRYVERNATYLFKTLPLDQWQPPKEAFEIAATWLLNFSIESAENGMARMIFSRLNWNFNKYTGELFLPHEIHIRMACLLVEVSAKHAPETIGLTGISESVRQVSNLVKGQTPQQQFVTWCWNMVAVLRLHCFDQHGNAIRHIISHPQDAIRHVTEIERLLAVCQGVVDNRPLAVYLSILMTLWGHSVPQICHKGFAQMQNLLNDYRHSSVIRCLQLVTPFFLECPESLSKCQAFQSILNALLNADRTYIRMAKDFISSDSYGPVITNLSNMIQSQIIDYAHFGLSTPTGLINLWLNAITANQNWYKDLNALHIVDQILQIAYQFVDSWSMAREFLKQLCRDTKESKPTQSTTFLPFLGSSNQAQGLLTCSNANILWLSLLLLEVEHEVYELGSKLWPELLRQMRVSPLKFNLDNMIKSCAKLVGCTPFPSQSLVLYKLANLIVTCSFDHPILPILCQRFFLLYLARVQMSYEDARFSDVFGVSDKFYEQNVTLMMKMKRFFNDVSKHEQLLAQEADDKDTEFHIKKLGLYQAFELWMDDKRINRFQQIRVDDFQAQYSLNQLAATLANNWTYWTEYINLIEIRKIQCDDASSWLRTCYRYVPPERQAVISARGTKPTIPKDSIIRQLNSYDKPMPPPTISIQKPLIVNLSMGELKKTLNSSFDSVVKMSKDFNMTVKELSSLDSSYKEGLQTLHLNKTRKEVKQFRCNSMVAPCKGSNSREIDVPYYEMNVQMSEKLRVNRDRYELVITKLISTPTKQEILPFVQIQCSIRQLLDGYRRSKELKDRNRSNEIANIANSYFYYMINGIDEHVNVFHPAKDLCNVTLSQIGIFLQDNQNTEGLNLLRTALKRPDLLTAISELIVPTNASPEAFISLYKFIIDSHLNNSDPKVLFVLLSKFEVSSWLSMQNPKLTEVNSLIQMIVKGLECWNRKESELIQGVLRRHLIHIFVHEFPEHYGEILSIILKGCSDNKLMPAVLLEIVNTIFRLSRCTEIETPVVAAKAKEHIMNFASSQRIFSQQELYDTMALFARHFQNERLQHGLHGLFPKHKEYIEVISIMLEMYCYSLIISAVHTNPGALSDKLVDWIWPIMCDMFAPWLSPYFTQNLPNSTANWIRQFNTSILLPWSELYINYGMQFLNNFINCIQFLLDTFPGCDSILGYVLYYYEVNYAHTEVPHHVISTVNAAFKTLPWSRLKPSPLNIEGFDRILRKFLPECHSFVGHIFLRVTWTPWLHFNISRWDYVTRTKVLATLLQMIVKLSCEPKVREHLQILNILQEAISYPWELLDYPSIETIFEWYVTSIEPSAMLGLKSEHYAVDNAILSLLQSTSLMVAKETAQSLPSSIVLSKRILYVKSISKLLRMSISKHQQLIGTPDGQKAFNAAVKNLMNIINNITSKDKETDCTHLAGEIIYPLQVHGEFVSKMFVDAVIEWQPTAEIGSVLINASIDVIGHCKTLSLNLFNLLESTIFYYFRSSEISAENHRPTWSNVIQRFGPKIQQTDINLFIANENFLCLHLHAINELRLIQNNGDKIIFLQNIYRHLEQYKITLSTESKVALIWGLLISCGTKLLETNINAKEPLLTLSKYLLTNAASNDGWGDGILGAIGLKKETISNKRRLLARALACIIFSLFPESSQQHQDFETTIDELRNIVKSKKFIDEKGTGSLAIDIVENQLKNLQSTSENVCSVIRLFYNECYLLSLEDVWMF